MCKTPKNAADVKADYAPPRELASVRVGSTRHLEPSKQTMSNPKRTMSNPKQTMSNPTRTLSNKRSAHSGSPAHTCIRAYTMQIFDANTCSGMPIRLSQGASMRVRPLRLAAIIEDIEKEATSKTMRNRKSQYTVYTYALTIHVSTCLLHLHKTLSISKISSCSEWTQLRCKQTTTRSKP